MKRLTLLTALLLCCPAAAEQIAEPGKRLAELYKSWTVDHSKDDNVSHAAWNWDTVEIWSSSRKGRHELHQVTTLRGDQNLTLVDFDQLQNQLDTIKYVGCKRRMINPRYAAEVTYLGDDKWELTAFAAKDTPPYADVVVRCRSQSPWRDYIRGGQDRHTFNADTTGWTGDRDGDVETFTYKAAQGNVVTLTVEGGRFVSEVIASPDGSKQTAMIVDGHLCWYDDGELFSKEYVKVSDKVLNTEQCYLAFYGLEEPAVPAVEFQSWWIGAGGLTLLGVGVVVQKLRGRALLSR